MGHHDLTPPGWVPDQAQLEQAERLLRDGMIDVMPSSVEGIAIGVRSGIFTLDQLSPELRALLEERHPGTLGVRIR